MNAEDEYQEILTTTLRKIGRNLLNYQLVERLWKSHVKIADVTVVYGTGVIEIEKGNASNRNIPMGWLAETHTKSLFSPNQDADAEDDQKNFSIKTSLRIDGDGGLNESRRKQVIKIVQERNTLVHLISEKYDIMSKDGCLDMSIKLDEENLRILEEVNFLKGISSAYQECFLEVKKYIESDEFKNELLKDL